MRGRSRLALTHSRLTQWRAQHGGPGIPVPEELWAEVVKVARVEGAGTTAQALRLDRARLEARMAMDRGAEDDQASGGFVELDAGGLGLSLGSSFGFTVKTASGSRSSSAWDRDRCRCARRGVLAPTTMIQIASQMRLFVAVEPADFRRGIDGLARVRREVLHADPFCGAVFVFRNRGETAIKILAYDGQGFSLCQKRLSKRKFRHWPGRAGTVKQELLAHELQVLLAGGDPAWIRAAPQWRRVPIAVP